MTLDSLVECSSIVFDGSRDHVWMDKCWRRYSSWCEVSWMLAFLSEVGGCWLRVHIGKKFGELRVTLWCWRRLLRVLWTARRCNQSILKEICPEYSLEGLMLKLKLQYFGHTLWKTDSLEKTLMLGKIEGRIKKGMTEDEMIGWHHWLDGHEFE